MQLAKFISLTEKTISRKTNEIFLAWYLSENYSKEEILEYYLNIIEYGPEIYGIKKASDFYFAKAPIELNLKESSFLAKMLPNPKGYFKNYCNGLSKEFSKKLYNHMTTTVALGFLDASEYTKGASEELLFTSNKEWMEKYCGKNSIAVSKDHSTKL